MGRTRRLGIAWTALMVAATLVAATATAQQTCDETAGTLGIQGMRCEGCTFRMSRSGIEEARFRTEPEIIALARGFTRGDALRAGDRIVALDGALITTREGGDRLVDLRTGEPVTVRVRRDGEIRELRLVPGSACELRRRADQGEVELERIVVIGPGSDLFAVPPAPAPAGRAPAPLPPLPDRPPLPAVPEPPVPAGYLGFGFRCSDCGVRDGSMFFTGPPVVQGLAERGPAADAGLRSGDEILAVNGDAITGVGGRTFGEVEPGDTVRLTVRRGDQQRTVTLVAGDRDKAPAPRLAPVAPIPDRLQFEGRVGDVSVVVRGAEVQVTRPAGEDELVIRTSDAVIRLRKGG